MSEPTEIEIRDRLQSATAPEVERAERLYVAFWESTGRQFPPFDIAPADVRFSWLETARRNPPLIPSSRPAGAPVDQSRRFTR